MIILGISIIALTEQCEKFKSPNEENWIEVCDEPDIELILNGSNETCTFWTLGDPNQIIEICN